MMENNKTIAVEYIVTRFEDGGIEVKNSDKENVSNKLSTEEIYNDLCDVAKVIDRKRAENAAYVGAKMAIIDFYASIHSMDRGDENTEAAPGEGLSL